MSLQFTVFRESIIKVASVHPPRRTLSHQIYS